jgi:hypothetical protein
LLVCLPAPTIGPYIQSVTFFTAFALLVQYSSRQTDYRRAALPVQRRRVHSERRHGANDECAVASTVPMESDGTAHGVGLWDASAPLFKKILLQGEVPFRGTVGIIDQHQARVMLQSFGLLDHGFLVLA